MPPEGRPVTVEVVRIDGTGSCSTGHTVGDVWRVDSALAPSGLCGWAYGSMLPFLQTLRFGGSFPWEENGEAVVCCPDPDNPVVFRLRVGE